MSPLDKPVVELAVALWLAVCGWLDARTRRVPNWLTNPLMVVAVVVAVTTSVPAFGFLLVVAAVSIWLWKSGLGMGGADAKVLIALAGLWPDGCIAAALSLAIFGLARAVWSKWRPTPPTFPAVAVMACGVCILAWSIHSVQCTEYIRDIVTKAFSNWSVVRSFRVP